MNQQEPIACLWIALAYYTGLPMDSDQVKKMALVVGQLAPYLPETLQPGHRRLYLEIENGRLKRVEPAQSYLIRDDGV